MATLTPIVAPSQLCVSCFVYRPPAHQEACDSCLSAKSHPSTPLPLAKEKTLGAWLEEWKASTHWWPDEFSYEIGRAEVSAPFAKKWETMVALAEKLTRAIYSGASDIDDLIDDLDEQMNLAEVATPQEEFLAECIVTHTALKFGVVFAETKADHSSAAHAEFILNHLAAAEKLADARARHIEQMMDEMTANCPL